MRASKRLRIYGSGPPVASSSRTGTSPEKKRDLERDEDEDVVSIEERLKRCLGRTKSGIALNGRSKFTFGYGCAIRQHMLVWLFAASAATKMSKDCRSASERPGRFRFSDVALDDVSYKVSSCINVDEQ